MSTADLIIAMAGALFLGLSKGGLKGLSIVSVPLMALVYGAKVSTGVLIPLLIIGDIMAVVYYNKHCKWSYLKKFLPAMLIGVLIGVWIGKDLPELQFKKWMSVIILVSVVLMFWRDRKPNQEFPKNWLFGGGSGLVAGFTSMVGNLAGAFANLFFLATNLPKNEIIGTAGWLFFVVNLFKLPFHIFVWGTVSMESLKLDLPLVPAIVIGFILGVKLVSYINEKMYRNFLLIATAAGAILIFLK